MQDAEGPVARPPLEVGAEVDVEALVAEIQAEVKRKIADGTYPPELLAEVRLTPDPIDSAVDRLRSLLPLSAAIPVNSKKRVIGPAISFGKRAVRRGMRWYSASLVGQLDAFATVQASAVDLMASRIAELEAELARTRSRIERLEGLLSERDQGRDDGRPGRT